MEYKAGLSFQHTAEYLHIEYAIKARWAEYEQLADEFANFVARKITDFSEERAAELVRLKGLNQTSSDESLLELIDAQIAARASLPMQFHFRFADRVMAEYVTIAFLFTSRYCPACPRTMRFTWLATFSVKSSLMSFPLQASQTVPSPSAQISRP